MAVTTSWAGATIQMDGVDTVTAAARVLTTSTGIDLDHDGQREFATARFTPLGILEIYEASADDTVDLVHTIDLSMGTLANYVPLDTGDADGDGLSDLLLGGYTGNTNDLRIYESMNPSGYPTRLAWQLTGWPARAILGDSDADGLTEVVVIGHDQTTGQHALATFEHAGNDTYLPAGYEVIPAGFIQSGGVMDDLDQDGRVEIVAATVSRVWIYESTGDDTYALSVTGDLYGSDGQAVNAHVLVDGGDLDGDGRRELLVGGRKTVSAGSDPSVTLVFVIEAIADNAYEIVATLSVPPESEGIPSGNVADLDGDGDREILIESASTIRAWENVADNTWVQIWSAPTYIAARSIGAADHDRDGKAEVIIQTSTSATTIYEIDPADAADADADGRVDAIDNCPGDPNPGQQDLDADGAGDACDTCVEVANPGQGPAVFPQAIRAFNREKLTWVDALDILYVRGPLDGVGAYTVDLSGSLPEATNVSDATVPAPGSGFYYLVRPDCSAGSWQTAPGAEPARDETLP